MTAMADTQDLVSRAKEGDRQAMEELFRRYKDPVLLRIRRRMGPDVRSLFESQDFLQDVFVEAVGSLKRFETRSKDSFLRWLATIVQNRIRDVCKRIRVVKKFENYQQNRSEDEFHTDPTPSVVAGSTEWKVKLNGAINRLPEPYQTVIRLRDFQGMEFEEIAKRTGKSGYEAAKKSYWRAVRKLATELDSEKH